MKKVLIIASLLTLGSTVALAQQGGGFTGPSAVATKPKVSVVEPNAAISTVEQAKQMADDAKVTLRGNITEHLRKDKYLFKDSTGEVTIEIDHDDWKGVTVGPNDLVEIYGEVDKGRSSVEIDVDVVRKVNTK